VLGFQGRCFFSSETKAKGTIASPNFLFHWGDYRNKGHNPEKMLWVWVLVKVVSSAWKLSTVKNSTKNRIVYFSKEIT
jgi:hypothetical protein